MIIGLNLKGSPSNPSVWFSLPDRKSGEFYSDEDIISRISGMKPELLVVDAPLYMPAGMYRMEDEYLRKRGHDVVSPRFKGMVPLVNRAVKISDELEKRGIKVLESNSKAFLFLVGKGTIKQVLGTENREIREAAVSALLGDLFLRGKAKLVGKMIAID